MNDIVIGQITDEAVEQMRRRIGYSNPTVRTGITTLPWNTEATPDAIRHFTESYGDDNPLYATREYGLGTRWGSQIAPPSFEATMGHNRTPKLDDVVDNETRRALRGVQLYHSGNDATFYQPIYPGDVLDVTNVLVDVEDKMSEFAGRSVITTNERTWWNQRDEVVAIERHWFVHAERKPVTRKSKYAKEELAQYTDQDLEEIERLYDQEYRRGAETWFIEDVEVGAVLPTMVKGPVTVTDMINLHMGAGWYGYGNPALRLAYSNRQRMPRFYTRNEFNAWDTLQRLHWEPELARRIGVLSSYDIGPMRWSWIVHYCTNLAGDDGWVQRMYLEMRRFNYMGDTTRITGRVVGTREDDLGALVDIEVEGVNQRGTTNMQGGATIRVASRGRGLAPLPIPPDRPSPRVQI